MSDSLIKFTMDGRELSAQQGETILQVAKKNGIEIPALCHNEKISHTTSCFVCVVKHVESGRFLPSCATVPDNGASYESSSKAVTAMRKSALELLLSEHSGDCEAPCTLACPAHAAVEEYVREGRKGDTLEALKIIKQRIPLPLSIGRVCPRFCEKDCRRNIYDAPVAINDFKRLAADLHYDQYLEDLPVLNGKKVAIVGSGPTGLAAAYYLRLNKISSDIYDAHAKPGGMLRYGIPEFRLPKKVLDQEIAHFDKMGGITFYQQHSLGRDIFLEALKKDYDAVILGVGCQKASSLRCNGEELAHEGIVWLHDLSKNDYKGDNPLKTVVIGGGNTAMDCVRTAVRLGSTDVICLYRRTENEMPAEKIEIKEAKEEGVKFKFLAAPVSLTKKGDIIEVTCIKMKLGEPDASGRKRPVKIAGSEFVIEANTVIGAVGQKTDAPKGVKTDRWGNIDADSSNLNTGDTVFAGGDCVTGAATVVEAVAAGRKMAVAITDMFAGIKHTEPPLFNVSRGYWRNMSKDDVVLLKEVSNTKRLQLEQISINERCTTFKEVNFTASKESIMAEGERCFECSCTAKHSCSLKSSSEKYNASPIAITGEKHIDPVDIRHPVIIHDRSKCIKCGICVKICDEVIGKHLLDYKNRGFDAEVSPALNRPLPDSCAECMACVDECPVGALDRRIKS